MLSATPALHSLIQALATTQTERELQLRFMDAAGEPLGAQAWGLSLFNDHIGVHTIEFRGVPEAFLERYQEIGRAADPVMRLLLDRHAPAHQQLLMTPIDWRRSAFYQHVCAPFGLEHILKGPIVGGGRVIGTVQFGRSWHLSPFGEQELSHLGTLCAHLSAFVATLRAGATSLNTDEAMHLTLRELQIAKLVAMGLSNVEIGIALQIAPSSVKQALKRMFRKLAVSSRAQMVAKLQGILRER